MHPNSISKDYNNSDKKETYVNKYILFILKGNPFLLIIVTNRAHKLYPNRP